MIHMLETSNTNDWVREEGNPIIMAGWGGINVSNVMILSLIKCLLCYFILLFFNLVCVFFTLH